MTQRKEPDGARSAMILLQLVVGVNLSLIALSFTTWYSGTAQVPGFADRLLGSTRSGGWRLDALWLILSNVVLFFVLIGCIVKRASKNARKAAILTMIELAAFVLSVFHALVSGTFDMG